VSLPSPPTRQLAAGITADDRVVALATEHRVRTEGGLYRIVALVGEHEVGGVAGALHDVVADAADHGVAALVGSDRVVAAVAVHEVGPGAGDDRVAAVIGVVAAHDRHGARRKACIDGVVAFVHEKQRIGGAAEDERQVVALTGEHGAVAEEDSEAVVAFIAEGQVAADPIEEKIVTDARDIGIIPTTGEELIVATVTEDDVGAAAALDTVVAIGRIIAAEDRLRVGCVQDGDRVAALVAEQDHGTDIRVDVPDAVVLGSAADHAGIAGLQQDSVLARAAVDGDRAAAGEDRVVAAQPDDAAGPGVAGLVQRVVSGRAGCRIGHGVSPLKVSLRHDDAAAAGFDQCGRAGQCRAAGALALGGPWFVLWASFVLLLPRRTSRRRLDRLRHRAPVEFGRKKEGAVWPPLPRGESKARRIVLRSRSRSPRWCRSRR